MSIDLKLTGHEKNLGGGFLVSRLLPAASRQSVGPFVFFDYFGPLQVQAGANHEVRPHPHIGLATVTYLFDGAILHRALWLFWRLAWRRASGRWCQRVSWCWASMRSTGSTISGGILCPVARSASRRPVTTGWRKPWGTSLVTLNSSSFHSASPWRPDQGCSSKQVFENQLQIVIFPA